MSDPKFAFDGYSNKVAPLKEGLVRKGGRNPASSLEFQRPPPPAPMRPAPAQTKPGGSAER